MITTDEPLTLYLTVAIGAYAMAGATCGFLSPHRWREILGELRKSAALTFVTGIVAFVIGVAIVMVHNLWGDPLAAIVSLIGWLTALEGLILIAYPRPLLDLAERVISPGNQRIAEVAALAIGLFMLAMGLTGSVT